MLLPNEVFGLIKPEIDVHTMGIMNFANDLRICGYKVVIANKTINEAIESIQKIDNINIIKNWILKNSITRLGFSYRLDPNDGVRLFLTFLEQLRINGIYNTLKGPIKSIHFAGLPETCKKIREFTNYEILAFSGECTNAEMLVQIGLSQELVSKSFSRENDYDKMRFDFAKNVIESEKYKTIMPQNHLDYAKCGKSDDNYMDRLRHCRENHTLPIIRTHCGPYNPNRVEALKEYNCWCKDLARSRLLDVLSIGSSQLTQSHFGENWGNMPNGGGIPVNSELEYKIIKENASPMLVRTYAGTKDVPALAKIHERSLNISWHALSFWWFNELDGRGTNTLLENLRQHFETLKYIASTYKPVEPNVPHHFAFRGSDDISYIISAYLAAKAIKHSGVKHMILQNMLNTPKSTWGRQDLAKSRALLKLINELKDSDFDFSLQTRAGLEYFSPNIDFAKQQLSAVTCLMDDIDPDNNLSPEIIHVVNYSEAVKLATPDIIKESIKITLDTLESYRKARTKNSIPNMKYDRETETRTKQLYYECKDAINFLEKNIKNLYSPEGFEEVFEAGFLPVPYLYDPNNNYPKARQWNTCFYNGGIIVVDDKGKPLSTNQRYQQILSNTLCTHSKN